MSPCIYPNCRESVDFGSKPIGYCPLGRHGPLFLCPYCRAPNRALASFCRKCGGAISFVEASQQFDMEFQMQRAQLTTERCRIDLSARGISPERPGVHAAGKRQYFARTTRLGPLAEVSRLLPAS